MLIVVGSLENLRIAAGKIWSAKEGENPPARSKELKFLHRVMLSVARKEHRAVDYCARGDQSVAKVDAVAPFVALEVIAGPSANLLVDRNAGQR